VLRRLRAAGLLLALGLLSGCEAAAYLGQAAWGQVRMVVGRRALPAVIADPATGERLRHQLELVQQIRAFAAQSLGMQGLRGFDSFVATGRRHAVWNVVAAPEFSVEPESWCYPVAGCVSYRGYFARDGAEQFARALVRRGFDTHVYGVAAYSTLGWFSDPVLDTWIMRDERGLAALVFHEYAHQLVYAPGDTEFSEAFARVVEREGLRRWLLGRGLESEYHRYLQEVATDRAFAGLLERTRERLATLYAQALDEASMRARKQELFERLRAEYAGASATWPEELRFDAWMQGELNNARLATVANYEHRVPALEALLAQRDGELEAFYAAARELATLEPAARRAQLDALAGAQACGEHRACTDG